MTQHDIENLDAVRETQDSYIETETPETPEAPVFSEVFAEELRTVFAESHLKNVRKEGVEALTEFINRACVSGRFIPMLRKATYTVTDGSGNDIRVIAADDVVKFCGPHLLPENLGLDESKATPHLLARNVLNAMKRSFTRKNGLKKEQATAGWRALCRMSGFGTRIESAPPTMSAAEFDLGSFLTGLVRKPVK